MSLQVWLPLNGSAINQGVAGFQPKVETILYTADGLGKIGSKAASGTIKLSAEQTASIFNNNAITIAFWIYPLSETNGGIIFGNDGYSEQYNNRKFSLFQWYDNTIDPNAVGTSLHWSWMNETPERPFAGGTLKNSLPINQWTHVCVTYQNPTLCIYINGECKHTETNKISNSSTFAYETTILHSSLVRRMNDLRIYNHCLSPREVKLLAQGLIAHYKLDNENPNLVNGSFGDKTGSEYLVASYAFDRDGFSRYLTAGEKCTLTVCFTPHSNFSYWNPHLNNGAIGGWMPNMKSDGTTNKQIVTAVSNDGWTYYNNINPETSNSDYTTVRMYCKMKDGTSNNQAVTIHWIKLQIGNYPTSTTWSPSISENPDYYNKEYDCSGYGNNGLTYGKPQFLLNSPRYQCNVQFNGNLNDKILCNTIAFNFTDDFSWSCWIKHNYTGWQATSEKPPASFPFVVGRADTGGYGYGLQEISETSIKVWFGSSSWNINLDESQHHLVFTKKETTINIYVDGTPTSYTFSGTLPTYSDGAGLALGCFQYSGGSLYPYYGQLSDFRIYTTALSAAAVKELYQSSISFLDNGTLQCSEIVESPTNIKYNQNGIVQANLINENPFVPLMKQKILGDGSTWARIHWLDVTNIQTYFTVAEVQECVNANNRFSLMKYVDYFKRSDGYYEFMLTHPKLSTTSYNRWKQTSSPNSTTVSGFSTIGTQAWTAANHGIRKHGSDCVYNCDEGGTWYAPIGQLKGWNGGIPDANQSSTPTTEIELWVRIDKNMKLLNNAIQATQIYEL